MGMVHHVQEVFHFKMCVGNAGLHGKRCWGSVCSQNNEGSFLLSTGYLAIQKVESDPSHFIFLEIMIA